MSEQPNNPSFGWDQAIQVTADAIVTRNGKPVENDTTTTTATVQED